MGTIEATLQFLNPEGVLAGKPEYLLEDEKVLEAYRLMVLTRHVDARMVTLQRQGTITFALSSTGEEACAVGAAFGLMPQDWIYPQYREVGALFARGFPLEGFIHNMFCNGLDLNKGRQMPNHFGSKEHNIVTVSSPIATKIPHAAGCAYAMKLQGEDAISLCFFGEGATSEGDFHAGLNFAAVLDAPCLFFCRNNRYAISTPTSSQFRSEGIYPKAAGYGIEGMRIDGNDLFAVYDAVKRARALKKPVLIEAMTYRLGAHSTSDDPSVYRKSEEVEEAKKYDPLLRLNKYLISKGLWNSEKESALLEKVQQEVTEAIEEAKIAPRPEVETMIEDVYFETPPSLKKQLGEVAR